jgi:ATP-binding cassette subfamily C protein LapB
MGWLRMPDEPVPHEARNMLGGAVSSALLKLNRRSFIVTTLKSSYGFMMVFVLTAMSGALVSGLAPLVAGSAVQSLLVGDSVTPSVDSLKMLVLLLVATIVVQFLLQVFERAYSNKFLRFWLPILMQKVNRVDFDTLSAMDVGYIARRYTSEIHEIPDLFTRHLGRIVASIALLVTCMLMLLHLFPLVTLCLLAIGAIAIPLVFFSLKYMRSRFARVQEAWAVFSGVSTDLVAAQFVLRCFKATTRMSDFLESRLKWTLGFDLKTYIATTLILAVLILGILSGALVVLVYLQSSGHLAPLSPQKTVAFLGYLWLLVRQFTSLSGTLSSAQSSMSKIDRVAEVLSLPEDSPPPVAACESFACIEIRDLAGVAGGKPVFSGVSLVVGPGEVVVINGKSGSGKTTLLKTLFGLMQPSAGSVWIDGREVASLSDLGPRVMFLPQEPRFLAGSLRWNMELLSGVPVDEARLRLILERVGLQDRLDLGTGASSIDLLEAGRNLSGGEKQRLALAAILLRRPRALLLDEPTSQIDEGSELLVIDEVRELARLGCTVFLVTHRRSLDNLASVVLNMDRREFACAPGS